MSKPLKSAFLSFLTAGKELGISGSQFRKIYTGPKCQIGIKFFILRSDFVKWVEATGRKISV